MPAKNDNDKKKTIAEVFIDYLSRTPPGLLFTHLLWIVIASCALSTSYIMAFHFTSLVTIYHEAHNIRNFSQNLQVGARKDQEIQNVLSGLLDATGSNRAYVYRYHNGLAAVSGVPFFFQTVTHEVITPGVTRVMQFEQRIPASINLAINNRFVQNMCARVENADEDRDSQNYWYFQSRQARALVRCPVFMQNGDLFGFVGIDYTNNATTEQLVTAEERIKAAAVVISSIFSSR